MKFFIFSALIFFSSNLYCQEKDTIQLNEITDSIDLSSMQARIYNFDLLAPSIPLISFAQGLYMPSTKIWFYKLKDSSITIRNFAISHFDSSLYILLDDKKSIYLINLKKESEVTQNQANLLKLKREYNYSVYPIGRLQYYLVMQDTLSEVFYGNNAKNVKVLTTRDTLRSFIAIDSTSFIICYKQNAYLYRTGENAVLLFNSTFPIYSVAFSIDNVPYISTAIGVFKISKHFQAEIINSQIQDGLLKCFQDHLYILSNKTKKIYRIRL